MKALIQQVPDTLMVALLFVLLFLFANVADAQSHMVIKGTVYTAPGMDQPVYGELVSSNGEHMDVVVKANGRFWVNAPANDSYVLRFSQPGCVTKEVVVDARAACAAGAYKLHKVSFDVVMHEVDPEEAARYTAPVGRIEFISANGRPRVSHHYELIPVSTLIAQEGR